MSDVTTLEAYGENIRGVRTAIPRMLSLFHECGIHATWAAVGMAMCRNKDELLSLLPPRDLRPKYADPRMSSYYHFEHDRVGQDEHYDPYHYGPSLVERILHTPGQELANHTFSHFYAVDGDTNRPEVLARDLDAHRAISATYGGKTTSVVFPRNQVSAEAVAVCGEHGMTAYRGNEDHFIYRARGSAEQHLFIRSLRFLDHYVNLSGHHTYKVDLGKNKFGTAVNVPASRFFRPYSPLLGLFEPLRMRRIKRAMTCAAQHGEVFHLWWHPHNFGIHQEENFKNLIEVLAHYLKLKGKYGFESRSMREMVIFSSTAAA